MTLPTITEANCSGLQLPVIRQAGTATTERTLLEYYEYLSEHLSLPFTAYYPEPTNAVEEFEFCCSVLEVLNPNEFLGDAYDGIFCEVRKGKFEVNIPLVELHMPQRGPNFQLLEGYWQWFWNWQTVSYCQR